jgi:(2Fe-2S) ferredoxin
MNQGAVPYKRMLFVCTNRRENGQACCAQRGSETILAQMKERINASGLARHVRVMKSGCHDMCAKGPSVVVFPDGEWYHAVTEADVQRIVDRALAGIQ